MRALLALTGALAAGLVGLTLVVLAVALLASSRAVPGPGGAAVTVHVSASVAVVLAQGAAERAARRGSPGVTGLASAVVVAVTLLVLGTQWWL